MSKIEALSEDQASRVEYHPNWDGGFRFFVDQPDWLKLRDWVESTQKILGRDKFTFNFNGHPVENRPGFRFGSDSVVVEQAIQRAFNFRVFEDVVGPLPDVLADPPSLKILGPHEARRGRPPGPAALGKFPLSKMTHEGQSLVFTGKFNRASLRNFASVEGRRLGREFKCFDTADHRGVVVVLAGGVGVGRSPDEIEIE